MRGFLIAACWALLLPAGVGALGQSGTSADPLSGKWGMDGLPYLELQFDGKSSVAGTTIWRHDGQEQRAAIATGTFDKESGALKLTGDLKNEKGEVVRYLVEGTVEKEVVAGTYRVGEQKGDFRFVRQ